MKQTVEKWMALVAVLVVGCAAPVFGARVPSNMVTGTVSAVSGTQIVVNGKSYSVKVQGTALRELQGVQIGQAVDLVLNGSPTSSASQVIGIHVHAAPH